jgi:hypothetical protein
LRSAGASAPRKRDPQHVRKRILKIREQFAASYFFNLARKVRTEQFEELAINLIGDGGPVVRQTPIQVFALFVPDENTDVTAGTSYRVVGENRELKVTLAL